jgi:hypothetical protein
MQPMPGPPHPAWNAGRAAPQSTDAKAIVALVLGVLSLLGGFCWLGLPLGIPAIIFGSLAHRDIRKSAGLAGGTGMATAGMVLGSIGSLCFLGLVGFTVWGIVSARSTPPPTAMPLPAATATATTTGGTATPPGGWGAIHVVDLHATTTPLRAQLVDEVKSAKTAGETVLVETVSHGCSACGEIARSMREPDLQTALAKVRLVRVDVDEHASQIGSMRMNEAALPWFYLLDAHGDARDAISADEWDDNDADEIAPVLESFLDGSLRSRRKAWRGTTF